MSDAAGFCGDHDSDGAMKITDDVPENHGRIVEQDEDIDSEVLAFEMPPQAPTFLRFARNSWVNAAVIATIEPFRFPGRDGFGFMVFGSAECRGIDGPLDEFFDSATQQPEQEPEESELR